jgi:hypothetical protein
MEKETTETRYLLGKLPAAEAALLEQRSFVEDSVFEEIEIAEDELIDAYVCGSLSSEDRQSFETKLLRSERVAERVEFAKLLSKSGSPRLVRHEPARTRWWDRFFNFWLIQSPALRGVAAACLLLIVFGIPAFTLIRLRDERRLNAERLALEQQKQQLAQQLAEQQAKTNQLAADLQTSKEEENRLQQELQATKDELARATVQPSAPASILLFSNSVRGPSQRALLIVPSTASTVRLKLVLESDDYASYQATIKSPSSDNVLTRPGLKTSRSGQSRIITLEFPSRNLSPGEYLVSVSGRASSGTYEPVADYSLRLSKK